MCEAYIGAGLDPARFWDITPRMMATEMGGAAKRHQRDLAGIWAGAMLPYMKKPPSYAEFVGVTVDRTARTREWERAWDRLDAALARSNR